MWTTLQGSSQEGNRLSLEQATEPEGAPRWSSELFYNLWHKKKYVFGLSLQLLVEEMGTSFVLRKHVLAGSEMASGWKLVTRKTKVWIGSWHFQPYLLLLLWRREEAWDWINHHSQWFNQSCLHNETSVKPTNDGVPRASGLVKTSRCRETASQVMPREGAEAETVLPYLALCISHSAVLEHILYDKLIIVCKVLSWVLWAILANY